MPLFILLCLLSLSLAHPTFRQQKCPVVLQPDQPSDTQSQNNQLPSLVAKQSSTSHPPPRIINGEFISSPNLREIIVAIVNQESFSNSFCTGSLIAPTWVLTAAHCEADPLKTSVFVGTQRVFTSDGQLFFNGGEQIFVQTAFNHPRFLFEDPLRRAHDIAILKLEKPALSTKFMRLNVDASQPKQGSFSRIMGYGNTVFMDAEPAATKGRLRQVDVPIFSNSKCNKQYKNQIIPDRQVCAGYNERECGSCQGDSGGPLFQYDEDDNPVQVGIVSFAEDCGQPGKPTVYVRPDAYIDWIRETGAEFSPGVNIRTVFSEGSDKGDGVDIGAIVGGVIACLAAIALIVLAAAFVRYRRNQREKSPLTADNPEGPTQASQPAPVATGTPVQAVPAEISPGPHEPHLPLPPPPPAQGPSTFASPYAPPVGNAYPPIPPPPPTPPAASQPDVPPAQLHGPQAGLQPRVPESSQQDPGQYSQVHQVPGPPGAPTGPEPYATPGSQAYPPPSSQTGSGTYVPTGSQGDSRGHTPSGSEPYGPPDLPTYPSPGSQPYAAVVTPSYSPPSSWSYPEPTSPQLYSPEASQAKNTDTP